MKHSFVVKSLSRVTATEFVQLHHYSPVMPKLTKHFLGFYIDEALVGILTLGWGTQPRQTINKLFPGLQSNDYYEIGKMCMSDDMPKNSESQMISAAIKWMKVNCPEKLFLYTMADGIMGKCGYVYQAANFYYGGKYTTQVYLMENGEKLHPRSTKEILKDNAKEVGKEKLFWLTSDYMVKKGIKKIDGYMFRYIYPLNKKALKLMTSNSSVEWNRKYPKDDSLAWFDVTERKNKKKIDKPQFTFVDAKYNLKNINAHKNHN
jgi:hypothetical protein